MREKTTGNDGGGLPSEGRNWGKIRPAGTISREGMCYVLPVTADDFKSVDQRLEGEDNQRQEGSEDL
jgi:hypothetical protein